MPHLALPGTWLFYEERGSGPPLVLIHAGGLDHRMWGPQVDAFAARYRVIRYEMRGVGRSEVTDTAVEYSNRQDLRELLASMGVKRTAAVGASAGGSGTRAPAGRAERATGRPRAPTRPGGTSGTSGTSGLSGGRTRARAGRG